MGQRHWAISLEPGHLVLRSLSCLQDTVLPFLLIPGSPLTLTSSSTIFDFASVHHFDCISTTAAPMPSILGFSGSPRRALPASMRVYGIPFSRYPSATALRVFSCSDDISTTAGAIFLNPGSFDSPHRPLSASMRVKGTAVICSCSAPHLTLVTPYLQAHSSLLRSCDHALSVDVAEHVPPCLERPVGQLRSCPTG
ncbi:hypothetical protein FPV67DRAFT_1091124 [Lyophyllum atratum]|nr:hypothetical protein FPV67DRAFT_1091124 [Lyophyllum atratum]